MVLQTNKEQKRENRFVQNRERRQSTNRHSSVGSIVLRSCAVVGTVLLSFIILFFGVTTVICKGPSPSARDLFVTTVMETSAAKFLARMYFTEEEIVTIQQKNAVEETSDVTDVGVSFVPKENPPPQDTVELVDVTGATFKGKMLIVHDPSRVRVSVAPVFDKEAEGLRVEEHVKNAGAVAGVNGGGFADENGVGKGGMPLGLVMKDSVIINGNAQTSSPVVGFDKNNKLIVGTMTGQQCLELGMRDALSFGPTFIVNGKAAEVAGSGGGLNPRTVIGQRADGAVLLLVIDGRQAHSIGASYKDCIDVMLQYGAVNAANLDGGSSSLMVYQGEVVNVCASLYGSRKLPTAFIVQ